MEGAPQVPETIHKLVEKYEFHQAAYKKGKYNETQLRREFIDPFFKTLGWDVDNTRGYSELYKEVIHEDPIRIRGSTEFIDYAFRIGGSRKFIVEAKKPAVNIRDDPGPALQIRRYAWNGRLPLSILTDFEEFAVYDCTKKPMPGDFSNSADKARHDTMVALVERMLALHRQRADVKTDHEKNLIERQIEATDKQIDTLVYELYDLTEEEIQIVEGVGK